MPAPQFDGYFRFLALVARADNAITVDERVMIARALTATGVSTEVARRVDEILDVDVPLDSNRELTEIVAGMDPATLAESVRDGYVVALIDGELAPVEVGMVDALLRAAGVPETRRPTLHEWARRAATHHLDGLALFQDAIGVVAPS